MAQYRKNYNISPRVNRRKNPTVKLSGDDEQTHLHTGLDLYALFDSLCSLLSSVFKNPNMNHEVLNLKNQLLLVLMKLWLINFW